MDNEDIYRLKIVPEIFTEIVPEIVPVLKHKKKTFKCNFEGCSKSLSKKTNLNRHMLIHSNLPKKYKCRFEGCSYSSHIKQHLQGHEEIHSDKEYKCDLCDYKIHTKTGLNKHKKKHNLLTTKYNCNFEGCSFGTNFKSDSIIHINNHKKNTDKTPANIITEATI